MPFKASEYLPLIQSGNHRAISRLISLAEDKAPHVRKVLAKLFKAGGKAQIIGITGPPGAGKSTLVDQLATQYKKAGKKVAILAVDPTSPFSGGAILGDRVRMARSLESSDIFIRSMATRGALGGLSHATLSAIFILDAAGFDTILVETVGVGQAEVDIVRCAHTCVVVLVPGMGDGVQAIKAGILEIGDLFAINKADRDGANNVEKDLLTLFSLTDYPAGNWRPKITQTVATEGKGIDKLVSGLEEHWSWFRASKNALEKRRYIMRETIIQFAVEDIFYEIRHAKKKRLDKLVQNCLDLKTDPISASGKLLK